jgi:hypothetical protein
MRAEPAKWPRRMVLVIVVSPRVVICELHHDSPSRLSSKRAGFMIPALEKGRFMIPALEKGRLSCWIF